MIYIHYIHIEETSACEAIRLRRQTEAEDIFAEVKKLSRGIVIRNEKIF